MLKVLSLFDWMSCWQISLNQIWIKDYIYYASEIDKPAIKITQKNYPNTIQIGDVTKINSEDYKDIDLLIWGSPCQGFSFAGKQLNFSDPRSKLFFDYVRLLKEIKPRYFLLENVKMKKEYLEVITKELFWVEPIRINSNLLTAQNRDRYYWVWELQSDWSYKKVEIEQPEDKGILLKDILDNNINNSYYISDKQKLKLKEFWATFSFGGKICDINWKASPILKSYYKVAWNWGHIQDNKGVRIFTENEAERLQGVPDNYTEWITSRQRYWALGNGWTIPIIKHIFSYLDLK